MAKAKDAAVMENGNAYILQAGTPIFVKTADICSIIGKSNQWVGQLTSQGVLNKSVTPHGSLYNLADNIRAYCEMLEDRATPDPGDAESEKIERDRRRADAGIKAAKAIIAGLDAKERQLKMHRSEDVEALFTDMIFAFRGAALAMIGRLSVEVVGIDDAAEVSSIIQQEVFKMLEDVSTYRYDSKKFEERMRTRLNMEAKRSDSDDDE